MIDSITLNQAALTSMALEKENAIIVKNMPTQPEFETIQKLILLLKPIFEMTNLLGGQKYASISFLYPIVYSLIIHDLPSMKISDNDVKKLCNQFGEELQGRFNFVLSDKIFLAATFLDFRFKKFEFISTLSERKTKIIDAKNWIIEWYETNIQDPSNTQSNNETANPRRSDSNETNTACPRDLSILERLQDKQTTQQVISSFEAELQKYQSHRIIRDASDSETIAELGPLYFFKKHSLSYHRLSKVA